MTTTVGLIQGDAVPVPVAATLPSATGLGDGTPTIKTPENTLNVVVSQAWVPIGGAGGGGAAYSPSNLELMRSGSMPFTVSGQVQLCAPTTPNTLVGNDMYYSQGALGKIFITSMGHYTCNVIAQVSSISPGDIVLIEVDGVVFGRAQMVCPPERSDVTAHLSATSLVDQLGPYSTVVIAVRVFHAAPTPVPVLTYIRGNVVKLTGESQVAPVDSLAAATGLTAVKNGTNLDVSWTNPTDSVSDDVGWVWVVPADRSVYPAVGPATQYSVGSTTTLQSVDMSGATVGTTYEVGWQRSRYFSPLMSPPVTTTVVWS